MSRYHPLSGYRFPSPAEIRSRTTSGNVSFYAVGAVSATSTHWFRMRNYNFAIHGVALTRIDDGQEFVDRGGGDSASRGSVGY
jgi:hypothetical protein